MLLPKSQALAEIITDRRINSKRTAEDVLNARANLKKQVQGFEILKEFLLVT
jgi:hypothetical protein